MIFKEVSQSSIYILLIIRNGVLLMDREFRDKMMELDLKATFMKDKGYAQVNIDDMASGMPVIHFRLMGQRPSATRGGKKKYSVYGRNIVEMSSKSILYTILK